MSARAFDPNRFLRSVYGTDPFIEFCRRRGIPFMQVPAGAMPKGDCRRWIAVQAQLCREMRDRVEWELAEVNELAGNESLTHLLAAVEGQELPSDLIPAGASVALWFLLHHPDAFHTVYLNQEIFEACAWRNAQTSSGRVIDDFAGASAALASSLREFFHLRQGTGRFCTVEVSRLNGAYCFVAHVADRLLQLESFTEDGQRIMEHLRPAFAVIFVYYPQDGTILLKSPFDADDRVCELFQRFGRSVLDTDLCARYQGHTFALDQLKAPSLLLPDAADMECVRIKTLHFRYPERQGRRQVKLETLASDESPAILQLIGTHMNGEGILDQMQVCYAELQVLLKVADQQSKSYFIRLWPNRCNLNHTPLGERLRACLKRWGLYHAA